MQDMNDLTLDELREPLMEALLSHAPFDGWSDKALAASAADLGIPADRAALVFPGGAADMMQALADWTRDRLAAELGNGDRLSNLKIRDKVTLAVRTRFETILGPHKEAIRRGSYILAQPRHAARAARLSWQAADGIWRLCGDTATDYNHYTKRGILAAILASTSLVWLNDMSPDNDDTWAFLERRIAGIMRFEKTKARVLDARGKMPSLSRFLGRLRYPAV